MKLLLASAVAFGLNLAAISASEAMTIVPLDQKLPDGAIIRVIEGCGPYGHRGPGGFCRPRWSCPPGWHTGPYGWHCFRNW
jgi:hypothetical protein